MTKVQHETVSEDRYQGCLLGLAIGDALGAPVEFDSLAKIHTKFGDKGIKDFAPWGGFEAGSYSDDTQMSLMTAIGCVRAKQKYLKLRFCNPTRTVYRCYLEWLETQNISSERRAPGETCLSALQSGKMGKIGKKINTSKGCGGVMRTAPVGLAFLSDKAFQWGAEFAAITHSHPSGYLPAGFLAAMIAFIIEGVSIENTVPPCMDILKSYSGHEETLAKVEEAIALAKPDEYDEISIAKLGGGWVAEEALAIAIYCSVKNPDNWARGVLAAVNHSGDSDSTGSITGAILGASLGIKSIPPGWVKRVENAQLITKIAHDMHKIYQK